jgi:ABC-type polysaccharide/polyol phosphate export permease
MPKSSASDVPLPSAADGAPPGRLSGDLREIVGDIWRSRDLLYQLALRDIRIRYKQAIMGFGWAIFMPLLIVSAGFLVRLAMATVSGGTLDRTGIAGIVVRSLPWAFFVGSIGFAVNSLTGNMNLVSKVSFPREVLPLAAICAQTFDSLIGSAAVAIALPFLGVRLTTGLLWAPVLAALVFCFTVATGLFLSCANLFFRDVKYIVQVLLTFGIFFTPVLYEPAMLGPTGARLVMLNPLAPLLEGIRLSVTLGHNLLEPLTELSKHGQLVVAWEPWYLAYSAAWALGGLVASAALFHRLEFVFAEYV